MRIVIRISNLCVASAERVPGRRLLPRALCIVAALGLWATLDPAAAQTLPTALVRAYQDNPQLNAERARQRATDENVPQALAGYRPQLAATLSAGYMTLRNLLPDSTVQSANLRPWSATAAVSQTLFNGFKTANTVRQSESQVLSGREALRNIEGSVFLDVVTAYTNVYAAQSLVEAQRGNVAFLRETLTSTRRRLEAGDVTDTDVAQADARLSRGLADLNAAEVALAIAQATYIQVIGAAPGRLAPAENVDRLIPPTRDQAVVAGRHENPTLVGATYDVDAAQAAIKIAEGALMPNVSVQGAISRSVETDTTLGTTRTDSAAITAQGTIPIYDGGLAASQVRQAKEQVAQVRLVLDRTRAQVELAVVAAWATNEGAKVAITASESEVKASELALQGVRREADAGQRVLHAACRRRPARPPATRAGNAGLRSDRTLLSSA
jgi:outer membrane protein